jgi:hypothetical protein
MLQIRYSAFETNSSSVHTFYIRRDFKPEPFKKPVLIDVRFDRFGTGQCGYTNDYFLDYCWTAIYCNCSGDEIKAWQERIEEVLKPYNVQIRWRIDDGCYDFDCCYVDHGDYSLKLLEELLAKPELFLSAVLCKDSRFTTDYDQVDHDENDADFYFPKEEGSWNPDGHFDHYKNARTGYDVFRRTD